MRRDRYQASFGRAQELRFASDSPLEGDGFEPSIPVARRGQAARNQIFRRTTRADTYVRRNKVADRLVRLAPEQPSRDFLVRGGGYLHRGIAGRNFERRFSLADHTKVTGASVDNGLVSVDVVREVPEAAKPRTIKIGSAVAATLQPQVTEQNAA